MARRKYKAEDGARQKRWRTMHPVQSAYNNWKYNSRKRGIPNEVTLLEFTVFCIETGYIYLRSIGLDVTIDRPRSLEGYKVGNMQLLMRADNTRKQNKEFAYGTKYLTKTDDVPF